MDFMDIINKKLDNLNRVLNEHERRLDKLDKSLTESNNVKKKHFCEFKDFICYRDEEETLVFLGFDQHGRRALFVANYCPFCGEKNE